MKLEEVYKGNIEVYVNALKPATQWRGRKSFVEDGAGVIEEEIKELLERGALEIEGVSRYFNGTDRLIKGITIYTERGAVLVHFNRPLIEYADQPNAGEQSRPPALYYNINEEETRGQAVNVERWF